METKALDNLESASVLKTPSSSFRKKSLLRHVKRRLKCFRKKPRFFQTKKEFLTFEQLEKFAVIYIIPTLSVSKKKGFIKLVIILCQHVWYLFKNLGSLMI